MRVVDLISEILRREGVDFLSCYPSTPLIEAAASAGIRPFVCRQERVGMGIADGFSRITNGRRIGVFAMQYGPGAENAFPGVATAYSDSVPVLVLPLGHPRTMMQVFPHFSSARVYAPIAKWVETITVAKQTTDIMRRAFNLLRTGRRGPVVVEVPTDAAVEEVNTADFAYQPVKAASSAGNPRDVAEAVQALLRARTPVILAGQGVLYAEACGELIELAESLHAPVITTLEGKSAFPEDHPLSLGIGCVVMTGPALHFLRKADTVFGIGCSFTRHPMATNIPPGKVMIQATNDERDINKDYVVDHPILGDAKLVLQQCLDVMRDARGHAPDPDDMRVASEVAKVKDSWMSEWMPKLTSDEVPLNPYRVIWEFMRTIDPCGAIVTHDSGSPRDQLMPFYKSTTPRGYIGWGKSHALGTGLGLIMGAKLAEPNKFCVNFMGDAAFGMTGLDFETAVRCGIPILTIVLNNSTMAIETHALAISHGRYRTRDIGGRYADLARAMGGYAERVDRPEDIADAIRRARSATEQGRAALLEFITSEEIDFSHRRAL